MLVPGPRQDGRPILSCKGIASQTERITIQGPEILPPAWIGLWPFQDRDIDSTGQPATINKQINAICGNPLPRLSSKKRLDFFYSRCSLVFIRLPSILIVDCYVLFDPLVESVLPISAIL